MLFYACTFFTYFLSYYPSSPSIRHAIPINTSQLYRTRNFHMSFTRLFITHLSLFLFFCFVVFLPQQYIIFDALLRLYFFYILSLITSLLTARDDRPTDMMDIDGRSYTCTTICQWKHLTWLTLHFFLCVASLLLTYYRVFDWCKFKSTCDVTAATYRWMWRWRWTSAPFTLPCSRPNCQRKPEQHQRPAGATATATRQRWWCCNGWH